MSDSSEEIKPDIERLLHKVTLYTDDVVRAGMLENSRSIRLHLHAARLIIYSHHSVELVKLDEPALVRSQLIDILLPIGVAEDAQINLSEMLPLWTEAHGERRARRIWRFQSWRIIIGHHFLPVIAFGERVLRICKGQAPAE